MHRGRSTDPGHAVHKAEGMKTPDTRQRKNSMSDAESE
jgi:hypothetical protein